MPPQQLPNTHLNDLSSLPPSSPPLVATSDPPEHIYGVTCDPPSLISLLSLCPSSEDEDDIQHPQTNGAIDPMGAHADSFNQPSTPPQYKGRELVGGDGSDPGVYKSSPVLSKQAQKRKARKQRQATWETKRSRRQQSKEREAQSRVEQKRIVIASALQLLEKGSATFGDLCLYVFDPQNHDVSVGWRWDNFYNSPDIINKIFAWMASSPNSKLACQTVKRAMADVVEKVVAHEADQITKQGMLRPPDEVDADFVLGLKFSTLPKIIKQNCPTMFRILMCIARTPRQEKECSALRLEHKSFVSATVLDHLNVLTYLVP